MAHDTVKTMAGVVDDPSSSEHGRLVFFLVPGDRELNPIKAGRAVPGVRLLEDEEFASFDIPKGSLGPVNAKPGTIVVGDSALTGDVSWGVGANEDGYHFLHAMPGRDFAVQSWADLVIAQPGDECPVCGAQLLGARGIEVSQVFQLGTKYSDSMGATFTDEDGNEKPFLMGSYGVGVSRSLAAVIEQRADEMGMAWPVTVAPLEVAVLPLAANGDVADTAERLASELAAAGIEVVIDDRDERAGVKFADADLIGWPYQVVVGKRGVAEGIAEVKDRATGDRVPIPLDQLVAHVAKLVADAKTALAPKTAHPSA